MALSMIVEITSLTPRVARSTPAMLGPRHADEHAVRRMTARWSGAGSVTAAPTAAATSAASRYWPSTPMLNRFILKPMATATPAR